MPEHNVTLSTTTRTCNSISVTLIHNLDSQLKGRAVSYCYRLRRAWYLLSMSNAADPTSLELLLRYSSSIWTVFISSWIVVFGALTVRERVRLHGRIPFASTAIKINSRLYSIVSLCFCLVIVLSSVLVPESLEPSIPLGLGAVCRDEIQRQLYHFSKLYEYLDLFLVLATGGSVGLHFAFHHLTVSPRTLPQTVFNLTG